MNTIRTEFTTTTRGLNIESPPYRLYEKAKRFGVWNPGEIDFSQDKADWQQMTEAQQQWVVGNASAFIAGEEAVTLDLLPLIKVIASEGRLEEEMFLTTFLFEEAKHVDFFSRFFREVVGPVEDLGDYHEENYSHIFYQALPEAMQALETDSSPEAQARASVIYNMIVEGVLAEAGYFSWFRSLGVSNILPGMQMGIQRIKQDESRHIAYAIFLLSRLIVSHESVWPVVEATFEEMKPYIAFNVDPEAPKETPFGLDPKPAQDMRYSLFEKRLDYLRRVRGKSLESIYKTTTTMIVENQEDQY